jgi:hypothetical protein
LRNLEIVDLKKLFIQVHEAALTDGSEHLAEGHIRPCTWTGRLSQAFATSSNCP